MVNKRDFDKILVNLLRNNSNIESVALIDTEGILVSFAVRSRQFQVNSKIIGSKTKLLNFLTKSLISDQKLSDPVVECFFFEENVIFILNFNVIVVVLTLNLKGWPLIPKNIYSAALKLKDLFSQIKSTKNLILEEILGEENQTQFEISDSILEQIYNYLEMIEKLHVKYYEISKEDIKIDFNEFGSFIQDKFPSDIIKEGIIVQANGQELYSVVNKLNKEESTLFKDLTEELEPFQLGNLLYVFTIFNNQQLVMLSKLGEINGVDTYCTFLLEANLNNIVNFCNNIYNVLIELNYFASQLYLKNFIQNLEFLGFSLDDLSKKIKLLMKKAEIELAELYMERGANLAYSQGDIRDAGKFKLMLAEMYSQLHNFKKAEQFYIETIELYLEKNKFEDVGALYYKLGALCQEFEKITKTFDYYNLSLEYYKKIENSIKINEIKECLKGLYKTLSKQLKYYLDSIIAEFISFSSLMEKFNLSEPLLIEVFKTLDEIEGISGQVNITKKRYTKKKIVSSEAIIGEIPIINKSIETPVTEIKIAPEPIKEQMPQQLSLVHLLDSGDTFKEITLDAKPVVAKPKVVSKFPLISLMEENISVGIESSSMEKIEVKIPESILEKKPVMHENIFNIDKIAPIREINISGSPLTILLELQQYEDQIDKLNILLQKLEIQYNAGTIKKEFYIEKKTEIAERMGMLEGIKERFRNR